MRGLSPEEAAAGLGWAGLAEREAAAGPVRTGESSELARVVPAGGWQWGRAGPR